MIRAFIRTYFWILLYLPLSVAGQSAAVDWEQKISETNGNFTGVLDPSDVFGSSVDRIGDLDNDGVDDIVVGAIGDDDGGSSRGAVWVLFLNANGTVKAHQKISSTQGGLGNSINDNDFFGRGVAGIGDLDGDNVEDIAVGVSRGDDGGTNCGEIRIIFLNTNGTVKNWQKVSNTSGNFGNATDSIDVGEQFGFSVAAIGDIDNDGVTDLAVGSAGYSSSRGAVWILFMNTDGTVKDQQKISSFHGNFNGFLQFGGAFGSAVSPLGDFDNDGVEDIVVGNYHDHSIWIIYLNNDGTVKDEFEIDQAPFEGEFGASIDTIGDRDGDGNMDIMVGANYYNDGGSQKGAIYVIYLNSDRSVKTHQRISNSAGNLSTTLEDAGYFGAGSSVIGDIDGDGKINVVVGQSGGDDGGNSQGAVFVLNLLTGNLAPQSDFSVDDDTISTGAFVNFTDESLLSPTSWEWTFTGGFPSTSTDQHPANIQYNAPGHYPVTLRTTNAFGADTLVRNDFIHVYAVPVADFTADLTSIVVGGSVNFTSLLSNEPTSWEWTFFGANPASDTVEHPTDIVYNSTGCFDVKLIGHNPAGSDTVVKTCYINVISCPDPIDSVASQQPITNTQGDFTGSFSSAAGRAVAGIGDLDGDGISDIAVGEQLADDGGNDRGAVHIIFLESDGTVKAVQKISDTTGNFSGTFNDGYHFGASITNMGDLDGDNVTDLVVGSPGDNEAGGATGAIWILFMNTDGTVKSHQKISDTQGNFTGNLTSNDNFGSTVANIGDMDGNGVPDLAVGSRTYDLKGGLYIIFLETDFTVKSHQLIANSTGGFTGTIGSSDHFGSGAASLGDLDGDGITDIGVGAYGDSDGGLFSGAIWILFMNANGTVKSHHKINSTSGDLSITFNGQDMLGRELCSPGDMDGDGIPDIVAGVPSNLSTQTGDVWVLYMDTDGTVINDRIITGITGRSNGDDFGWGVDCLGDTNGDGFPELVVGVPGEDAAGSNSGGVWLLNLTGRQLDVDFTADQTNIVEEQTVNFSINSTLNCPTTYSWSFPGGIPSTSTLSNPAVVYNDAGCYTATLIVWNGISTDTVEKTCYINVSTISYCTPTYTNGTNDGDFIDGVVLNEINNTGTGTQNGPSYHDYTNQTAFLIRSGTYDLDITSGNYTPDWYKAWIDFNRDGDFDDASEDLGAFQTTATYQTQTIQFTVPAGAGLDSTRLRVRCAFGVPSMDPCANISYGEAEDYTVVITDTITWTGAMNTEWNQPGNWSPAVVPNGGHIVMIPGTGQAPTQPIITEDNAVCRKIHIDSDAGALVEIKTGGKLEVKN